MLHILGQINLFNVHENQQPSEQNKTLNRSVRQPFTAFSKKIIDLVDNSTLVTGNATNASAEIEQEQEEGDAKQRDYRQNELTKLTPVLTG